MMNGVGSIHLTPSLISLSYLCAAAGKIRWGRLGLQSIKGLS